MPCATLSPVCLSDEEWTLSKAEPGLTSSTACIVLGEEGALTLLKTLGYDGLLIREDMTIVTTPGLKDRYPLQTAGQAT